MKFPTRTVGKTPFGVFFCFCLFSASIVWVAPCLDHWLHPQSPLFLPNTITDSLLYRHFIERAAEGFSEGDPFLWEHRLDRASFLSVFHFWPKVYGFLFARGGEPILVLSSILFSSVWYFALFVFSRKLGQSTSYALFSSGLQTFFVVNFAYQALGFRTHFQNYNFIITEHMRLYPTVTAMAVYSLAAVEILTVLERFTWIRAVIAGFLCAWVVYGRPFDWLTLIGALSLFAGVQGICQKTHGFKVAGVLLGVLLLGSIPFLVSYTQYQSEFGVAFFDQLTRGNLQVKNVQHYVKYILLSGGILLLFVVLNGKLFKSRRLEPPERSTALLWLFCLVASALLVHLKSFFEGGKTMVGFHYTMIFGVIPWSVMVLLNLGYHRLRERCFYLGRSPLWVGVFLALLIFQQIKQLGDGRSFLSRHVVSAENYEFYQWFHKNAAPDSVVLTMGRGLEFCTFSRAWLFVPHPAAATYTCSASTEELLHRFLLAKVLLTRRLDDLNPLFESQGLRAYPEWKSQQGAETTFWLGFMEQVLGLNTFIFHPEKNRGELQMRGIPLPPSIMRENGFVVYFPDRFRMIFKEVSDRFQAEGPILFLKNLRLKYKLDFIYLPVEVRSFFTDFLKDPQGFKRVMNIPTTQGALWQVGDFVDEERVTGSSPEPKSNSR